MKFYFWFLNILSLNVFFILAGYADAGVLSIDSTTYRLLKQEKVYILEHANKNRISVPIEYLHPPEAIEQDDLLYITSFNYAEKVSAFPIGNGWTGVHLSSYETQKEGSAQAANGRDVFLAIDPLTKSIHHGNLVPGITKSRVRSLGCFHAQFNNFVIGDVNGDGLTDIGVDFEKIWCEEKFDDKEDMDVVKGPYYQRDLTKWFLFHEGSWVYSHRFDGKYPEHGVVKLPLLGLEKSPIEYVKERYKGRLIIR